MTRRRGLAPILACVALAGAAPVTPAAGAASRGGPPPAVRVALDQARMSARLGAGFGLGSTITNVGRRPLAGLIAHLNVVSLTNGVYVDPEDWSPQRTQYIDALPAGQSQTQSWRVNAILDGDYLVYMVLVPAPEGADATTRPVASSGLHLTVTPFTKLNPAGVLPYAVGGPAILLVGIMLVYRARRSRIDMGSDAD